MDTAATTPPHPLTASAGDGATGNGASAASAASMAQPNVVTRAAMERLDEERARLAASFALAPIGLAHVAPDGTWLRVNPRLAALLGYTPEELLAGGRWQDLTHPDDVGVDEALVASVLRGERDGYTLRKRYVHKDGTVLWAQLAVSLVRTPETGAPFYFVSVVDAVPGGRDATTERVQAYAEAEAGQRLLAAVLDHLPEGLTIADAPDVTIRHVSRYGQQLTQRPLERLAGIPADRHPEAWAVYHPEDAAERGARAGTRATAAELPLTRATVDGEVVRNEEWVLRRADGAAIPILCNAGPIRDAAGVITGGLIAWRDIADLKAATADRARVQAETERRAAVLTAVLENMPDAVYVGTAAGVTLANHAALDLLGYASLAELNREIATLGEEIQTRDPTTGRRLAPEEEAFVRALRGEDRVELEVLIRHRVSGEDRRVRASAAPVRDATGQVVAAVCVSTDVTAERRAERELREAAEAMPQLVWITTPEGYHEYYNARWYAYTGMPRPAAGRFDPAVDEDGWNWKRYLHPDDYDRSVARWAHALATGDPYEIEYRFREAATGAYRWFLGRALPLRDATGRIARWFGTCTDIHEQRLAREAAERAQRQAEAARAEAEAARVEAEAARAEAVAANLAKGQFLATMSHELRTPLNAIQGHVQLLEMELHGPITEAQRTALGRVERAQRHLLGLINNVLNFAKLESGTVAYDLRATDVQAVLADVAPMVEPQLAAKGHAYTVAMPDGPCLVWADAEKLRQVLLNLLANAVKFTPPGGRIHVAHHTRPETPDVVYVQVADTGPGIPREKQDTVFDPFVQVHAGASPHVRAHEGTGLGLAISRELSRGMGGELRVRSTPGEGATFTLTLRRVVSADGTPLDRRTDAERREDERRSGADRRDDAPDHATGAE